MKIQISLIAYLSATAAIADPGHLTEVAGHGHWVAGAAIGIAVVIGLWTTLKGKTAGQAEKADDGALDDEAQEA